jgi:hypothetical protein
VSFENYIKGKDFNTHKTSTSLLKDEGGANGFELSSSLSSPALLQL